MLQPIMPLIEYQTNKEYIASVLCENRNKPELACDGKCYLNKKIKESKNHDSHEHSLPQIDLSKYPISMVEDLSYNYDNNNVFITHKYLKIGAHPNKITTSLFRPPIV